MPGRLIFCLERTPWDTSASDRIGMLGSSADRCAVVTASGLNRPEGTSKGSAEGAGFRHEAKEVELIASLGWLIA
ncbi:MAG: hypothetical protein EBV12_10585 [Betaproteobacteria bacterium]|nr:hypothetical protein [Betaproteobacteria bacterium]NBY53824.1 hypothetical protein [Betaproteobacteria bacterium]NCW25666.1 hypothetical protein [Betaproteobacteria bacterium]